jgi:DNA-binding Xre family transcriptional regulator
MATTWKLRDYLHERRIKPAALARKMDGKMSRTAVYGLVQVEPPKAVYLETLDAVLPALRELTGEDVTPNDLFEYVPDPEPEATIEAESALWLNGALTPTLEAWEWGPEGEPKGQPVDYVPGEGLYIHDDTA